MYAQNEYKISIRQACILFSIRQSVYYYRCKPKDDEPIREHLAELAELHSRWGFWMMHHHLRNLSHAWNHKRVYRIYTEMGLNLRRKHKKRLPQRVREPLVQPLLPNVTWSMDFMHDGLTNGIRFRSFNVIDDFNREALNISIDKSLTSHRVIRELEKLIEWRGKPEVLRVDNGPEFIAHVMEKWTEDNGIELRFIQKGKPHQNGYVERFNRTYRDEVLNAFAFNNLAEARVLTNAWIWIYNNERPHSSLKYMSPCTFLLKYGKRHTSPSHVPTFATFQKDKLYEWKSLLLDATN